MLNYQRVPFMMDAYIPSLDHAYNFQHVPPKKMLNSLSKTNWLLDDAFPMFSTCPENFSIIARMAMIAHIYHPIGS